MKILFSGLFAMSAGRLAVYGRGCQGGGDYRESCFVSTYISPAFPGMGCFSESSWRSLFSSTL